MLLQISMSLNVLELQVETNPRYVHVYKWSAYEIPSPLCIVLCPGQIFQNTEL